MFFFLVGGAGPRAVRSRLPGARCPACARAGAVYVTRVDHVLSIFFVPLITLKRGVETGLSCEACGWSSASASSASPLPPPLSPPPPARPPPQLPPPQQQQQQPSSASSSCARCGASVAAGWAYCPACGAAV